MRRRIRFSVSTRRSAVHPIVLAAAAALMPAAVAGAGQTDYTGFSNGIWSGFLNWDNGVPVAGSIANLFNARLVNYNLAQPATPVDLYGLQIANGSSLSISSNYSTAPYLQVQNLMIGGSVTGRLLGSTTATGAGSIAQSAGTVYLDPGGPVVTSLLVDSVSSYSLSGSGFLESNSQQIAGTFTQSSGLNELQPGSSLNISTGGTYNLSGSGVLTTDLINNAGTFLLAGASVQGNSPAGVAVSNTGVFNFSGGTFNGSLTNAQGATTNIIGAEIPFTTITNNGRLTINDSSGSFSGTIAGNGTVTFTGSASSVQLTSGNTLTGTTNVAEGTLMLDDTSGPVFAGQLVISSGATVQEQASGQLPSTVPVTINGGSLQLGGFTQNVSSLSITGGSVQQSSGAGLGLTTGNVTGGKGTATITGGLESATGFTFNIASGGQVNVSGSLSEFNASSPVPSLAVTGGGTLVIGAGSPLATISVTQGSLQFSAGGSFENLNTSVTVGPSGVLNLNNQSVVTGDLFGSGRVALGSGIMTVNSIAGSTYTGEVDGTGGIVKAGTGTLSFGGSNLWTGQTNVSAGTLAVGTGSTLASTTVIVAPLATLTVGGTLAAATQLTDNGTVTFAPGTTGTAANPVHVFDTVSSITIGSNFAGSSLVNGSLQLLPSTVGNRTVLYTSALTFAGTTAAPKGTLDLTDNDMIVHNGNLATVFSDIGSGFNYVGGGNWQGQGITSSTAATDTTHLTAVGVILNTAADGVTPIFGGPGEPLFDGIAPAPGDVLVKYTYFGDTNLDGKVDGSDYTNIDSAFAAGGKTGWFNGDFNYDGVIDGSDYSLIDNADNNQQASITGLLASVTAEVATVPAFSPVAVPEPTTLAIGSIVAFFTLRRRAIAFLRQR